MTAASATLPTGNLSELIREETRQAHDRAEHSSFMEKLLGGELDAAAFISLQEQAYLFYSALEDAVDACAGDSRLDSVADRKLDRRSALVHDLTVLGGTVDAEPLPETAAYVAELQRIGRDRDVPALIAHHYTRYLGDLAGGQVIGRLMGRLYGVDSDGLTFYDFPHIPKVKVYRDGYRNALDALELSAEEQRHLLDASSAAFAFNSGVFEALGRAQG
ncbi:biliverdin-producing heme oxygenase [Corynebacterium terpenotabidum]|uniref:heme oxygenase (biliverdin-producing) n=1 Tax=Corynebacterium terpenotabidum Y-11 TaxID=1200352 RepID=S4XD97_9CORY|nr:biliverdin-producing heme oxygenase [Corynebacterium terpenotabidum]AGP30521.1 heme oxygenase [Corynebacterium terpenotabidum Y-11]